MQSPSCVNGVAQRLFPPPPWMGWEGAEAGAGLWPPGVACGQIGPSTGSALGEGTPRAREGGFLQLAAPQNPPGAAASTAHMGGTESGAQVGAVTPRWGLRATSVSPQPARGGDILCEGDDGGDFVTLGFLFLFFCRREGFSELSVLLVALSPCPCPCQSPAVPTSLSQPYLAKQHWN